MPPKKTGPAKPAPAKGGAAKSGTKAAPAKQATEKPAAKAEAPLPTPPPERKVPVKQFAGLILDDGDGTIKSSKWWPYCVDERDIIGRFMQARDVNIINGLKQDGQDPERIRNALLGSLRYGKPFVFDQMEADLYEALKTTMDSIVPGLLGMVLDKSILETENIMKIVKDTDDHDYQSKYAYGPSEDFKFIVLTNTTKPTGFSKRMHLVTVE